jgi:hypothetical protein
MASRPMVVVETACEGLDLTAHRESSKCRGGWGDGRMDGDMPWGGKRRSDAMPRHEEAAKVTAHLGTR